MSILDRYLLRSLAINYLIALAVMMSLYVVLDLFLARMRRNNELTAVLASGISLYRIAVPIIAFGLVTTLLWVIDTEVAIPSLASRLARAHDDAGGEKTYGVWFLNDRDGALVSAQQFIPGTGVMRRVMILKRSASGAVSSVIEAEEAMWEKLDGHPLGGRWVLTNGQERFRPVDQSGSFGPQDPGELRDVGYYESNLTPAKIQMRQSAQWISFLSTSQLARLASRELPPIQAMALHQARHRRFAAPIVSLVLLLLGIPFLLDRDPGTIMSDIAKCLAACGICFAVTFVGQSVLRTDTYSALPAWLPIILFTPLAVVLIDRIRT